MNNFIPYIFFLLSFCAYGQQGRQVAFSQLSVNDGLSQNSVVSIAQDSTGFLWFATQDGLNKYDGRTFIHYQKFYKDITRDDYSELGKVYAAPNGNLYSISIEGLEMMTSALNEFIPIKGVTNPSTLFTNALGDMFVGTFGNGLYRIAAKEKDTLQVLRGKDSRVQVYQISEYKNNMVAATNGVLLSIDPVTLAYQPIKNPTENLSKTLNFSSLAVQNMDILWAGTYGNGLFYKEPSLPTLQQFVGFSSKETLPTNLNIQALLVDSKGRLWIGTYGNGAYRIDFETESVQHFIAQQYNPQAIHYSDVLCIFEDYTGVIWLGTDGGGISYYDENLSKFNQLTNFQTPIDVNVDVVRAITQDNTGTLWLGTSGKGLSSYHPTTKIFKGYQHNLNAPKGLPSNRVMSLVSNDKKIWIGFQDAGLSTFSPTSGFKNFDKASTPKLTAETVWCMLKNDTDDVWLGTRENGLIQFSESEGVLHQYTTDNSSITSNNLRVIVSGGDGELWVGTENNGLVKFLASEEIFVPFQKKEILKVKSLYYRAPYLWIGTNGNGLQALHTETEKITSYTQEDGLPNNVIYGILPDAVGNLWLSSNRGITRFYVDKVGDPAKITNYDIYDGLQAMEFNTGASYKSGDGNLYFGGLHGVNWFDPNQLSGNLIPPRTEIIKLELFAKEISMVQGRRFGAKDNTISFTFAGLHFSQPESNQYKYVLTNYENDWSVPSTNNFAHYPNLPSGDYTFKVLSSNYEGVWDESPATYNFTIHPPWYLTLTAKIAYILVALLLFYTIYTYLKWRWKMQIQLQFEHQETERLKKLDELKSRLYTNISHEFRTPLTLISAPVQQLISSTKIDPKDKKNLEIIKGSSQRMLRLVNQLLDLSKLEKGVVQLQVKPQPLQPQLIQLIEAFTLRANEKGIHLQYTIDPSYTTDAASTTWYDWDVMEKIVSNLLSNAVKYAPENSRIQFSALPKNNRLVLETTNKNESLNKKQIDQIFDRFYQVDKNVAGVGVGLSLIKELATLCNGWVSAKKKNDQSISFEVVIPITKEGYNANSISIDKGATQALQPIPSPIFELEMDDTPQILVVEDNPEIRSYIASLFIENCIVNQAKDGLEGIKEAIKTIPDLIISDVMMPRKDGVALCDTLKADSRTSHIPIILLTAKTGDSNELLGLKSKADDYITKPFNAEVVRQKVINMINSRRALRQRYSQNLFLKPKDIAISSGDEAFLEDLEQVLDNKLTDPSFNAEVFASEMTMSRMQLHRKIKALAGLSTSQFIRTQRLRTAAQILELEPDITINEVAYAVGFNTPSYFIKCFKEVYKLTPSEYLKK